jgi:hypothetical protein
MPDGTTAVPKKWVLPAPPVVPPVVPDGPLVVCPVVEPELDVPEEPVLDEAFVAWPLVELVEPVEVAAPVLADPVAEPLELSPAEAPEPVVPPFELPHPAHNRAT